MYGILCIHTILYTLQFRFISGCKAERDLNISECSSPRAYVWCNINSSSLSCFSLDPDHHSDDLQFIIVCMCTVVRPFIDVNCDTKVIQNTEITWDVASDRSYRYTIIDKSVNSTSVVESEYNL